MPSYLSLPIKNMHNYDVHNYLKSLCLSHARSAISVSWNANCIDFMIIHIIVFTSINAHAVLFDQSHWGFMAVTWSKQALTTTMAVKKPTPQ